MGVRLQVGHCVPAFWHPDPPAGIAGTSTCFDPPTTKTLLTRISESEQQSTKTRTRQTRGPDKITGAGIDTWKEFVPAVGGRPDTSPDVLRVVLWRADPRRL